MRASRGDGGERGDDFAAVTVHALDGGPIRGASRSVVTVVGRAENPGMAWNATRTSVGDQWGTGPVEAYVPPMTVSLDRDRAATVWALDVHGARKAEVNSTFAAGRLTFAVSPADATVWYEVAE